MRPQGKPWRQEIQSFIARQQPFQLSNYIDATGQPWQFDIHHARLIPHEEREYLDCWSPTTEGNLDLPPLQHNWCFRLDRYQGAAILPLKARWRSDLDRLTVTFHLYGRLAHSYAQSKRHQDDRAGHWLDRETFEVERSINNTYWFNRELRRYGADCYILSPDMVRDRFMAEVQAIADRYTSHHMP